MIFVCPVAVLTWVFFVLRAVEDVVRMLLEAGADWNVENAMKHRPIDEAVSRLHSACAEVLATWSRDHTSAETLAAVAAEDMALGSDDDDGAASAPAGGDDDAQEDDSAAAMAPVGPPI
jgi:hypothetical protein